MMTNDDRGEGGGQADDDIIIVEPPQAAIFFGFMTSETLFSLRNHHICVLKSKKIACGALTSQNIHYLAIMIS